MSVPARVVVGAALASLLAVLCWWGVGRDAPPTARATPGEERPSGPSSASVGRGSAGVREAGETRRVEAQKLRKDTSTLAAELRAADDLRAFALAAARRPAEGGLTYALYVGHLCRELESAVRDAGLVSTQGLLYAAPEDPRDHAARVVAFERAGAACANFAEGELSAEALTATTAAARTQNDRSYDLSARLSTAIRSRQPGAAAAALRDVLDDGDPLLLKIALEKLVRERALGAALAPAGEPGLDAIEQRRVRLDVLDVLPCRLGLVCDQRAADVLATCLTPGTCYADRIELARAALSPAAQRLFDSELGRFEKAARERRADVFFGS